MKDNYDASAYLNAEAYIYEVPRFTSKNSLQNTREWMKILGNPGLGKKIVHVAGTNGKGSVCAYLSGLFVNNNIKTGLFVSPHLISMNERICINGIPVSRKYFVNAFEEVMLQIKKNPDLNHPTFFELLFLISMKIFEKEEVEVLILETGLGGRLDATNVVDKPWLTIITRIGLDHCMYLGDTKEEIAKEKVGILKRNVPVVYESSQAKTREVIEEYAQKLDCPMYPVNAETFQIKKNKYKSIDFSYNSRYYDYIGFCIPTCAPYQAENISLALQAYELLMPKEKCRPDFLQQGIDAVRWEGRMEEICPGIYVDGAHNEDGIMAFLDAVRFHDTNGKNILCFSVVKDKDYRRIVSLLVESNLFAQIIVLGMDGVRGFSMQEMKTLFMPYRLENIHCAESVKKGIEMALADKNENDIIYIAGSLYLVGSAKVVLRREMK